MVMLIIQNRITDFLMILACDSPFNLRLMSIAVDILRFYWHVYNQLLKVKRGFNFETLIYVGT